MESYIDAAEARDETYSLSLNRVNHTASLVTMTPWLRHTKWEQCFMGKDMAVLNELARAPDAREYDERWIWAVS